WDTTKAGKHALDYLTTYNYNLTPPPGVTVDMPNPLAGVTGLSSTPNQFAIPIDPNVTASGVTQVGGQFLDIFGGTITGVVLTDSNFPANDGPYNFAGTFPYAGDTNTTITISFTCTSDHPVLAWGGHIASRLDWGAGNSAGGIQGSPYHMFAGFLDGHSTGNQ